MLTVKPAKKEASVITDPFILAGTEESDALIINQVTEVFAGKVIGTATQETFQSDNDTGNENNEDGEGKNDSEGDDNDDGAMDVDTSGLVADAKFLESLFVKEVLQRVLTEVIKAIEDVVLAPFNIPC
ncbi:hypothetical protein C0995_007304 [Termitomyces sp. Mi166|nr:hypothetical protein C0995_007304 [Termitomyces sp. Mi166\